MSDAHSTDLDIMSLDWRPQRPRAAIAADMTLRNRGHHHSRIIASRRHCPRCSWSTDSVRRQKKTLLSATKNCYHRSTFRCIYLFCYHLYFY